MEDPHRVTAEAVGGENGDLTGEGAAAASERRDREGDYRGLSVPGHDSPYRPGVRPKVPTAPAGYGGGSAAGERAPGATRAACHGTFLVAKHAWLGRPLVFGAKLCVAEERACSALFHCRNCPCVCRWWQRRARCDGGEPSAGVRSQPQRGGSADLWLQVHAFCGR